MNNHTLLVRFGYDAVSAVNTDSGIVVIDAGISTELASRYRKLIQNEFRRDKFSYVINTHGHHDHTGGNTVFPEARIIGYGNISAHTPENGSERGKSTIEISRIVSDYDRKLKESAPGSDEYYEAFTQKIRYMSDFSDSRRHVPARLPDISFNDSITIDQGNIKFEIFYFGKAHSDSDILIYIPGDKLIFTGDLFSRYGKPSFNISSGADMTRWRKAAGWIEERIDNIEDVIDGHGQILPVEDLKEFNNKILNR